MNNQLVNQIMTSISNIVNDANKLAKINARIESIICNYECKPITTEIVTVNSEVKNLLKNFISTPKNFYSLKVLTKKIKIYFLETFLVNKFFEI